MAVTLDKRNLVDRLITYVNQHPTQVAPMPVMQWINLSRTGIPAPVQSAAVVANENLRLHEKEQKSEFSSVNEAIKWLK